MIAVPVRAGKGVIVQAFVEDRDAQLVLGRSWRLSQGYAVTRIYKGKRNGVSVYREVAMHRLLLELAAGDPRETDHINRDRLDNQRVNLRVVTRLENAQNQGAHRRWTRTGRRCGYRGVHWDKAAHKWKACARLAGKQVSLGYYDDPETAAATVGEWRRTHMPFSRDAQPGGEQKAGTLDLNRAHKLPCAPSREKFQASR